MSTELSKWTRATHFPHSPSHTRSEELRYALDYTHLRTKGRRAEEGYQPGDIAACHASLVRIFYDYLELQGYSLSNTDYGARNIVGRRPLRYCVVNRHLEGSQYEVYILTTFRHAQNLGDIPWMGQYFSIPMGATRALSINVPPIVSHPPFFGEKSPSFLFAIPTRQTLVQTNVKYRVPHSELQRISEHTHGLTMELPKHQRLLRESVRDMYWGEAKWGGDHAALAPSVNMEREREAEESTNDGPFVKPYVSQMRSPVFKIGTWKQYVSNELGWVLRNTQQDFVEGSSNYLTQKGLTRSRHCPLKPPYYAPCLRLPSSRIMQLIR